MNFHQVLKLIPTKASVGRMSPVGVMKPMMLIPYKYAFTISLPGMFIKVASDPMIGMVRTAIPEDDAINKVKTKNTTINAMMKRDGGKPAVRLAAL